VAEPDWAIRYQDTLYVGKRVHGTFLVGELDARSSRREEWRTRWRTRTIPVLSGDGQAMASVHGTGRDATLVVDAPVGRQRRRVPARAQPVGIFGFLTPTVVFEVADDGGVWTAGLGRPTRRIPRMRTATSVDAVHSRIAATDATGVAVLSLANREVLWHVDGSRPLSFSPDGTMVVLVTDLAGRRQLDVVAAGTGVPVVQLGSVGPRDQLFLTGLLWEDSAHLLATALWHGNQGILRLGIDGTITSALGWTAEPPSLIRFAEPGAARYVEPGPPVTGSG
jgi:hypothetical protein